jgi:DNA/RNA endonuclease YhcR with UshA esterase domain
MGCVVRGAHAVEKQYGTDEAINHVGEHATVGGFVVTAEFAKFVENQPTFLNLATRYPNEVFTAVIWGADRSRFDYAPERLLGESICVTGEITQYRGIAQIIVTAPEQIERK